MFDRLRKLFSRDSSKRKVVRHTALTVHEGKIGFIAVDVDEADFRRKAQELKGQFLVRTMPGGQVEAFCNSCHTRLVAVEKDQLVWYRCPGCHGISFDPTANVSRDVQFAIDDGKPFEHESHYVRALPPGQVPPFSAEEIGDAAWAKSPYPVVPLPDQPLKGSGCDSLQEIEKAIAPCVQRAMSTYADAKQRFLAGLPDGAQFFTTVRLQDNAGSTETAFIKVHDIQHGIVAGTIASPIDTVSDCHFGKAVLVLEAAVMDWTIAHADGTMEGNFVGRFIAEMQKSRHD